MARNPLLAEVSQLRCEIDRLRCELDERSRAHDRLAPLLRRLAHRLASPLGVIRGRLQLLDRNMPGNERVRKTVEIANRQVMEIDEALRAAVKFAELEPRELEMVSVLDLAHEAVSRLSDLGEVEVAITGETTEPCVVGDPELLTCALENIIKNAIQSQPEDGAVLVCVCREQGWIRVRVIDRGRGMPGEVLEKAFEPMYSGRPAGAGLGLGLSIAAAAVEGAGGSIRIDSTPGRGTCCTVDLPPAPGHPASPQPRSSAVHEGDGSA